MEVMSPGSKNLQTYLVNRMLVYVYREFLKRNERNERHQVTAKIAADELSFLFSNLTDAIVKRNLKNCAYLKVSHQILTCDFSFLPCCIIMLTSYMDVQNAEGQKWPALLVQKRWVTRSN